MKRFLNTAGWPAIAFSAISLLLSATGPSLAQKYNYDLPGYVPNRGSATGGPSGGADQRSAKRDAKAARKVKQPQ